VYTLSEEGRSKFVACLSCQGLEAVTVPKWGYWAQFSNGCASRPAQVKTPEDRVQVLELLEYIARRQQRAPKAPGMFASDYRKVKKMLGLE